MTIRIFTTGGTIDGLEYNTELESLKMGPTLIPEFLKRLNLSNEFMVEQILYKDSKFITDADRELMLKKCLATIEERILITHGTASMADTAKFLDKKVLNKTVVLTGAMVLGTEKHSDALENLAFAIDAVKILKPGVYIAICGEIFEACNVRKNLQLMKFEKEF